MAKRDYYETLGVNRGAGDAALKSAYRKLAMRYHPDRNSGDTEAEKKFKEINEAYDILKDTEKRAAYDRFGHDAFEGGMGARSSGFEGFGAGFADIFDEMFGGGRGRRSGRDRRQGADLRYNMTISIEEAFSGRQAEIRVPSTTECSDCGGSGAAAGSQPQTCGLCHGAGNVRAKQGVFTIERTCHNCGGAGRVIEKPCRACRGAGRVQREKTLSVDIPAGVEDGTRIRLSGEGDAGAQGAPPGDLYIFISVEDHPLFRRDGADVYCSIPLMMTTAALGGQIDVPTVEGSRARINISPGTQTGTQFRLRGKGMTVLRSAARGDLYVTAVVETPMNLDRHQKKILEGFAATQNESTSPESNGFFDRVKGLWGDRKD